MRRGVQQKRLLPFLCFEQWWDQANSNTWWSLDDNIWLWSFLPTVQLTFNHGTLTSSHANTDVFYSRVFFMNSACTKNGWNIKGLHKLCFLKGWELMAQSKLSRFFFPGQKLLRIHPGSRSHGPRIDKRMQRCQVWKAFLSSFFWVKIFFGGEWETWMFATWTCWDPDLWRWCSLQPHHWAGTTTLRCWDLSREMVRGMNRGEDHDLKIQGVFVGIWKKMSNFLSNWFF